MSAKKTTEQFIIEATEKHEGKYTYEKAVYTSNKNKLTITCPDHGDFEQVASGHLSGKICIKCSGSDKKTTEQFIIDANIKHNYIYTYHNAIYTGNKNKLTITCKDHGDFEQRASDHLHGFGCIKCSGKQKTTEQFIIDATAKHKGRYTYDRAVYTTNNKKITITCPDHGDFEKIANDHLSGGSGCVKCSSKMKTAEQFIIDANIKHNGRYTYHNAIYTGNKNKITITCLSHGDFEQKPNSHLNGSGCIKCSGLENRTSEQFIIDANAKHNGRYRYDKSVYTTAHNKIIITCQDHGDFEQIANRHLRGDGCPSCAEHGFKPSEPAILYYIRFDHEIEYSVWKVGISNNTAAERIKSMNVYEGWTATVLLIQDYENGADARKEEKSIHEHYKQYQYKGRPIMDNGNTELFTCNILGM